MSTAAERWSEQLAAWAIPQPILDAAPESPWGLPVECFRRRAESGDKESTPTTARALEALPEGGTVLDVGVGGGATSFPLAERAGQIIGVDAHPEMLQAFVEGAGQRGVDARAVTGSWPDVAPEVEPADVAVCGHVFYNVSDLAPFATELDAHARVRVAAELTEHHPLDWLRDLWLRFHDLERPTGPTADDARAVLAELGFDVHREDRTVVSRHGGGGFARREDAIHLVRRRLCLPASRDEELADALGDRLRKIDDLWDVGPDERTVITLWWDTETDTGQHTTSRDFDS